MSSKNAAVYQTGRRGARQMKTAQPVQSAAELQTALSALFTRWESAEARYYAAGRSLEHATDASGLEYTSAWREMCAVVAAARDLAARIEAFLLRNDFDAGRGDTLTACYARDVLPLLEQDQPDVFGFACSSRALLLEAQDDAAPECRPDASDAPQRPGAAQELILEPAPPPRDHQPPPAPKLTPKKNCADASSTSVKPLLMTPAHAAAYLSLTEKAVRHQIADGKLPVVRRGRRVFINTKELDRLIAANTELPKPDMGGHAGCQKSHN